MILYQLSVSTMQILFVLSMYLLAIWAFWTIKEIISNIKKVNVQRIRNA